MPKSKLIISTSSSTNNRWTAVVVALLLMTTMTLSSIEAFVVPMSIRTPPRSTRLFSERDSTSSSSQVLDKDDDDDGDNDIKNKINDEPVVPRTSTPKAFFVKEKEQKQPTTTVSTMPDVEKDLKDDDWALNMMTSEIGVKKFLNKPTKPDYLPLDVVWSRTLDTIEDVVIHLRRKPFEMGWISPTDDENDSAQTKKKTVVVLGSGWASHALMKVADTFSIRLIVVSPVNHFVFTPMLASASVGSVEYRSMTEAVRASNPMIDFIEGKAVDVDVENKQVTIQLDNLLASSSDPNHQQPDPIQIDYDTLICAVGTKVQNSKVPGADKYCYYLKTCDDSRKLRNAVGEALEYASRPDVAGEDGKAERRRRVTFCIVGGGPTGVELAGELSDFFKDICKPHKGSFPRLKDDVNVMLVHGGNDLVSVFEKPLRDDALRSLRKRGVDVRLNTYTTEVGDGYVKLMDKFTKVEETVPIGLSVWAAGVEAVPFSKTLLDKLPEEARGPSGRIRVDKWLRPPMPKDELKGSIMVLGDAASSSSGNDDSSNILPQTAQVAGQQGAYVARLINRQYDMTQTPPTISKEDDSSLFLWLRVRNLQDAPYFTFLNLGVLAYVGGGEALSQVQLGDVSLLSWAGSVGFVLWRSVYLVKQVATRNRVLVTFDWIKTAVFGRDVTRL